MSSARKSWVPGLVFDSVALMFLIVSSVVVIGSVIYLYLLRFPCRGSLLSGFVIKKGSCDVFDGAWVSDDSYPLYNSSKCPFAERGFDCLANGRKDRAYLKLRWKPRRCDLPKFSPRNVLESIRGKRVVFVGDSMSRTQWESLICMLTSGVGDPASVYEVNGSEITKTIRFLGVRFESYNLSVEFFRSVFLVRQGSPPKHGPRRVRAIIELDKVDEISNKWVDSDILVFNSGHWWTPSKLSQAGRHFQAGGRLKLVMPINAAFRMALHTWASWVEKMVDTNRTQVFFRTYEPSHWSGSNGKGCNVSKQPPFEDNSEFGKILKDVVTNMRVPVTLLNVTSMGLFRSDAHIGIWNYPTPELDCSHWCLPGVPDAWNELLFSYLFTNGWRQLGR